MDDLSPAEFELRFQQLQQRLDSATNDACIECTRCGGCSRSTFCQDSERLVSCHYCVACSACTDCSHCRHSARLVSCAHCVECEDCSKSSYLVRCLALSDCTYCFGCVGLSNKDFHILNEPYERQDYFRIVGRLSRGMRPGR